MKKLFTILAAVLLTAAGWAQSPGKMSYQAVVRDASDNLIPSTTVGMQISILQGSASGTAVYIETQTPTTNANGLLSLEIGTGTTSDDFSSIDWSAGPYFIKTEMDPTGGTNYNITGTSQLLSVPYALHAKTAEIVTGTITETDPTYTASEAANITIYDITNLGNLSGANTGDQDLSSFAVQTALEDTASAIRSALSNVSGSISIETDPAFGASDAASITAGDITKLGNLSGLNTGDQDISGIATNANAISTIQGEKTNQDAAIAANTAKTGYTEALVSANTAVASNTAKTGISAQQAGDITANNAKTGYTEALVSANADVVANTAKTGITTGQANEITANTAKVSYPAADATKLAAITGANTGDQDISGIATNGSSITTLQTEQTTQNTAIALNTAKTGISAQQAGDITANNAKTGYTEALVSANADVVANTAKTGITTTQANAIISNTDDIETNAFAILDEVARATATEGITVDDIAILEVGQVSQDQAIALNSIKTDINSDGITVNTVTILNEVARATAAEGVTADDIAILEAGQVSQDQAIGLNSVKTDINSAGIETNAVTILNEVARATAAEGVIADDILILRDVHITQETAIALNTAKTGITTAQANEITASTGKDTTGIYHANRVALDLVSGTNTGDQDLSSFAVQTALEDTASAIRSAIPDVSGFLTSETDPVYGLSIAAGITGADTTNWNNDLVDDADADTTNEIQNINQVLIKGNDANGNNLVNTGKIGVGTASPNAESSMEIATALPVIFPSMTQSEVNAIATPVEGMVQFNADAHKLQVYAMLTDNASVLNEIFLNNSSGPYNFILDQSITSPIDGQVVAIEIMYKDVDGGEPFVDFFVNGEYQGMQLMPSYTQFTWHTFTMSTPVQVTAGMPFYIEFFGPGVDFHEFATNSNYPGGSGCCFASGDDDLLFRVHIQPNAGSYGWQSMH